MDSFSSSKGQTIVLALIKAIQGNAAYLSDIDGAIGDGDHGINMNKGFSLVEKNLPGTSSELCDALSLLGDTLLTEIGGSMGPLYGTVFLDMADTCSGKTEIDSATFLAMLKAAVSAVESLGDAKRGDKTLLDTLIPATEAFETAVNEGDSFAVALGKMATAAEAGKESTRDLVAKIGRASRLGERSRGHLDPGATSCYLLLQAFADSGQQLLGSTEPGRSA
jgi:dihydroxyacetone kinase-like protein